MVSFLGNYTNAQVSLFFSFICVEINNMGSNTNYEHSTVILQRTADRDITEK